MLTAIILPYHVLSIWNGSWIDKRTFC